MKFLFESWKKYIIEGEVVPFVPRERYDMNDWERFSADMASLYNAYPGFSVEFDKDNNGQQYVTINTNLIKGKDLMAKMEGEPLPPSPAVPPDPEMVSFDEEQLYVMTDEDMEY